MIECKLCGKKTHSIALHIIKAGHDITIDEYKKRYPLAEVLSEEAKVKIEHRRNAKAELLHDVNSALEQQKGIAVLKFFGIIFLSILASKTLPLLSILGVICGFLFLFISLKEIGEMKEEMKKDWVSTKDLSLEAEEFLENHFHAPHIDEKSLTLSKLMIAMHICCHDTEEALKQILTVVVQNNCADFIKKHIDELTADNSSMIIVGKYGLVDDRKWKKLIEELWFNKIAKPSYFEFTKASEGIGHPLSPDFSLEEFSKVNVEAALSAFKLVFEQISLHHEEKTIDIDSVKDGFEYEHAVAKLIEQNLEDWKAAVSVATGDQGLDVMATHSSGKKIAIQCKLYSSSVGNKAVQEIHSAKSFYRADKAIVVTNNTYTKSAKELGASLDIDLLHHAELVGYLEKEAL